MFDPLPTIADIRAAQERLGTAILQTPCIESRTLSQITGCTLFLKFENLQFTASFKERGALNKLLTLPPEALARGVCAMSAGNHAQGLAYHARRLGAPAVIVMPIGTPMTKITRTRDHGARVEIAGSNLTEALAVAERLAAAEGLSFVHPYDDPAVIAGQGTLALEMLAAIDDLDTLIVPIGGGGLISGIAIAAKALKSSIRVVGVQSRSYPSMQRALQGETAPCADRVTIAEGIAVKSAGLITREIVRACVDEIALVEEASIERAIALLMSVEKTVVEGAGATGLAALLEHREAFAGQRVATVLSGGNIDLRIIASVAMRELARGERLLRMSIPISDQPGALAVVAHVLGEAGANIIDLAHDRMGLSLNPKDASLNVVLEVQDAAHGTAVLAALADRGFAPVQTVI